MIIAKSKEDVLTAYVIEGLRRLYSVSIDKTGSYVDYDMLVSEANLNNENRLELPFMDIFCPEHIQHNIIDKLVKEKYKVQGNSTSHKLKEYEQRQVSISITLGPSPCSSFKSFLNSNAKNCFTEEEIDRFCTPMYAYN